MLEWRVVSDCGRVARFELWLGGSGSRLVDRARWLGLGMGAGGRAEFVSPVNSH